MANSMPSGTPERPRVVPFDYAQGKRPRAPRVGVPWRTSKNGKKDNKLGDYLRAVQNGGGDPVPVSLYYSTRKLKELACSLDAILLPGSPADVDPKRYCAKRRQRCGKRDKRREETDLALLKHAFSARKPVLAICYGIQSLNVYLDGTLVQDIPSELGLKPDGDWDGRHSGKAEAFHRVRLQPGSVISRLAGRTEARVNSTHHQAILEPGHGLRIVARAPDGVIEAVEGTGKGHWVVGVQWHPERMAGDAFSAALFRELIAVAGHR